jgi:hypothetical protein
MGAALLLATACNEGRPQAGNDWFDAGTTLEVKELVAFTTVPYDIPSEPTQGIGAMLDAVYPVSAFVTAYGVNDQWNAAVDCESEVAADLPWRVEGVVTLTPRWYFKTFGCDRDDEKFYGAFFIEDATGGIFVLGDSKVAHFEMGDRVVLDVRGARTLYGLDLVYAHDVVSIERRADPIYYQESTRALGGADIGEVRRVSGVVSSDKDTFGEFRLQADSGIFYTVNLDAELSRRGVGWPVGTRIQVTGPVLYSYSTYSLVVMRKGQVTVLD